MVYYGTTSTSFSGWSYFTPAGTTASTWTPTHSQLDGIVEPTPPVPPLPENPFLVEERQQKRLVPRMRRNGDVLNEECSHALGRFKLDTYFKNVVSHAMIKRDGRGRVLNDQLAINCYNPTILPDIVKEINIESPIQPPDVFFDHITSRTKPLFIQNHAEAEKFYLNDKWVGTYYPDLRLLETTDWTHSITSVGCIALVWPKILKEIQILPIHKVGLKSTPFIIGADPELETIDSQGKLRRASGYIKIARLDFGDLGVDGAGDPMELRPVASENPAQVVNNIKEILNHYADTHEGGDASVKGDRMAIGFHIHLSKKDEPGELDPNPELIKMLDDSLGIAIRCYNGRARGSYDQLGAWRRQPWGFEYRSLPSIILVHPVLTEIALKIAKNVCETYHSNTEIIYNSPFCEEDYRNIAKLTPDEVVVWTDFLTNVEHYKSRSSRILATWLEPLDIDFTHKGIATIPNDDDEWNPAVARRLVAEIQTYLNRSATWFDVKLYHLRVKDSSGRIIDGNTFNGGDTFFYVWNPKIYGLPTWDVKNAVLPMGVAESICTNVEIFDRFEDAIMEGIKAEIKKIRSKYPKPSR